MAEILTDGFDTRALLMEPMWLVTYLAPREDIDRIFDAVRSIVPLVHGRTDQNGYRVPGGFEYYRPKEGTPTGAEEEVRKRPDVEEMRFCLPRDETQLSAVIDIIYEVNSYYEPVIFVQEILRSQTKGLDDSKNPNRWWNKGGDWKS